MEYLSNKNGFLGIDNKVNFKERVIVVPFGLEKTVSYGGGTKNGPKEIIKASHQVELYDEELKCEPYKNIGILKFRIKSLPVFFTSKGQLSICPSRRNSALWNITIMMFQ